MRPIFAALAVVLFATSAHAAAAPSVETFKQVLEKRLQTLKRSGASERQVLFQNVVPGRPNGGYYPFTATILVRDYGAGYPANKYYGDTCIGHMDNWKFDLIDDGAGGWTVQGRLTADPTECKPNPAAGVSSVPVSALAGTQASAGPIAAPPPPGAGGALYVGEYACYGVGSRIMAGMGFKLQPGGRYTDVDGGRGGSYAYNAGAATIRFNGGFLSGQTGSKVTNRGFQISSTVSCEPWR